jgi:hypothetical protein
LPILFSGESLRGSLRFKFFSLLSFLLFQSFLLFPKLLSFLLLSKHLFSLFFGRKFNSTLLPLNLLPAKNGLSLTFQALFILQKGFSLCFLNLETLLFS